MPRRGDGGEENGVAWLGGAHLELEAKGDTTKVVLTRWLRAETKEPVSWIAKQLRMGTWGHANCHWCRN